MVEIANIAGAPVEPRSAPKAPPKDSVPKPAAPAKSSRVEYNSTPEAGSAKSLSIDTPGAKPLPRAPQRQAQSVSATLSEANENLRLINADLAIEVDHELKQVIFKVIDLETGETIKQIPSEEMIRLSKKLKEIIENYSNSHPSSRQLFIETGSFI